MPTQFAKLCLCEGFGKATSKVTRVCLCVTANLKSPRLYVMMLPTVCNYVNLTCLR